MRRLCPWLIFSCVALSLAPRSVAAQPVNVAPAAVAAREGSSSPSTRAPAPPPGLVVDTMDLAHAGVGMGLVLVGAALRDTYLHRGDLFRRSELGTSAYRDAEARWVDSESLSLTLAASGATLLSAAAVRPLVRTTPRALRPWLVVASSAAAVAAGALLTWGAVDVARGGSCDGSGAPIDRRGCSDERERQQRGAFVLSASMPFVTASLTLLIRRLFFWDGG